VRAFAPLFHRFFLAPFTQSTYAASRHLFIDQKQTPLFEKHKKTAISPYFLKFKKFHFSFMLICAILKIAISTGNTNPIQTQTNPISKAKNAAVSGMGWKTGKRLSSIANMDNIVIIITVNYGKKGI